MLMKEIRFIQDRFVNSKRARSVEDISRTFAKLVFQGKLTAAIKLLDKENSSGLLNLPDEVLAQLKEKHPVQLSFNFQLSTLFHKTISYNRLARKIAIANLGGPVKRKIN